MAAKQRLVPSLQLIDVCAGLLEGLIVRSPA
jgi:hypothetical protein